MLPPPPRAPSGGESEEGESDTFDPSAGIGTYQSTMAPGMAGGDGARMTRMSQPRSMPPPPVGVRGGVGGGTGGATGV